MRYISIAQVRQHRLISLNKLNHRNHSTQDISVSIGLLINIPEEPLNTATYLRHETKVVAQMY